MALKFLETLVSWGSWLGLGLGLKNEKLVQWGEEGAMLQLHVATFGAVGEEELHRGGGRCSSWLDYENNVSH